MVTHRRKKPASAVAYMALALSVSFAVVGFMGFGWANAGSQDTEASTFGLERTSAEAPSGPSVDPQKIDDKADDVMAVDDVAESASLETASSRDASAGVKEIEAEEKAAAKAAKEAAAKAEKEAIARADANRSAYYATFGDLPAGDVDFSIGKKAFVQKWTKRINAYLMGSPLSGHGETFAEAAWEHGIDPRWSPAISNTESTKGRVCFKVHNAWGWDQTNWSDWDTAINAHVAGLARGYGFTISYSYAMRYCPPNYDNWYRDTLAQMSLI